MDQLKRLVCGGCLCEIKALRNKNNNNFESQASGDCKIEKLVGFSNVLLYCYQTASDLQRDLITFVTAKQSHFLAGA